MSESQSVASVSDAAPVGATPSPPSAPRAAGSWARRHWNISIPLTLIVLIAAGVAIRNYVRGHSNTDTVPISLGFEWPEPRMGRNATALLVKNEGDRALYNVTITAGKNFGANVPPTYTISELQPHFTKELRVKSLGLDEEYVVHADDYKHPRVYRWMLDRDPAN